MKITLERWDRYCAFCYFVFNLSKYSYFASILACKESRICISVQNTNYSSMHNQACSSIRLRLHDEPLKIPFLDASEWSKASKHGLFITSLAIGMPRGFSSATAIARAEVEAGPSKYLDAGKILTIEQYNQTQLFWPVLPSLHEIRFRKVRSWISTSVDRRCNI